MAGAGSDELQKRKLMEQMNAEQDKRSRWLERRSHDMTLACVKADFDRTGNPYFVWLAWAIHRLGGGDLPEWLGAEFDRMADAIMAMAKAPPKEDVAGEVGRTFGFGGQNPFREFRLLVEDVAIANAYLDARVGGAGKEEARERIAPTFGLSGRTVERRLSSHVKAAGMTLDEFEGPGIGRWAQKKSRRPRK